MESKAPHAQDFCISVTSVSKILLHYDYFMLQGDTCVPSSSDRKTSLTIRLCF